MDARLQTETRKNWRKLRFTTGVCSLCPRKKVVGKTLCRLCLEKLRSRSRDREARMKRDGCCTRCSDRAPSGRTMCLQCSDRMRRYRRNRVTSGRCGYCPASVKGKTICRRCSDSRKKLRVEKLQSGQCGDSYCKNKKVPGKKSCQLCIDKRRVRLRLLKQEVFDHYGQKCACPCGCDVTKLCHLTIDHKNGDGAHQRRMDKIHGGQANYRGIIRRGFPDDLQVLCWNCNCAKAYSGGCS